MHEVVPGEGGLQGAAMLASKLAEVAPAGPAPVSADPADRTDRRE